MKIVTLIALLFALLMSGCKTTGDYTRLSFHLNEGDKKTYIKHIPEKGVYTTIKMGESIVSSFRVREVKGIELLETVQNEGKFRDSVITHGIRPALLPIVSRSNGGVFYGKQKALIYSQPAKSFSKLKFGGLYVPNDKSKGYATFFGIPRTVVEPLKGEVKYKEAIIVTVTDAGFRRDLVYTGKSGDIINLTYKEFKDGLIRASFTQTLTYDISEDKMVGFKSALFEVKEFTNSSLTFKVINHL